MTTEPDSPIDWTPDGQPRSRRYGDVYFSAEDGLAETRAVFLDGCGLPGAWAARRRFVVGELGFGTGLNIAALLELWRGTRPPGGQLHVFTVEAHPISAQEAARALSRWPEIREAAAALVGQWPTRARGVHRMELPEFGAVVDVDVRDAGTALKDWLGRADAWFLDGFSPALNPQMWSDEVLGLVAQRSAPGARAATFTVAGHVRRALAMNGFEVEKRPGFGRKRERLEARRPARPVGASDPAPPKVAIVGGGIAGASVARAVRALGVEAVLYEAERLGAGGSGNPAALVTPRLDAGLGAAAELFARAFARAVQLYEQVPEAIIARSVLQLAIAERDPVRFAKIAASDLFAPDSLGLVEPHIVASRLGETAPAALDQASALVVDPAAILREWSGEVRRAHVRALERDGEAWVLQGDARDIGRADAVILANALAAAELRPDLPLQAVRGQASHLPGLPFPQAAAWGGYVLPTRAGLLFGATHDRGDAGVDVRPQDHTRNVEGLRKALPELAARLDETALDGRAAVRAVTPDRLPVAGEVDDGLFVLTGFGSRGFSFAPLLAEHVAAMILAAPSPLGAAAGGLVSPDRFASGGR